MRDSGECQNHLPKVVLEVHSKWIYDGIRSTGLSGIRSTVEPSGLISMVHSGSISMLEMTGRSQSTLYYRVDIVLLCVKSR